MKFINLIFCLSIFFSSCNNFKKEDDPNPTYFDKVILDDAKDKFLISYEKGSKYLDSVYSKYPNVNRLDLVRKYKHKAYVLKNTFFNDALAIVHIDSAINLISDNPSEYSKELIGTYILKSEILISQYHYDDAFKYLYLAKKLNERNKDLLQIAYSNELIANVLFLQKKYQDAIRYFRATVSGLKLVENDHNQNTFKEQQKNLNNIGLCYERAGLLDSATNSYLLAIKYVEANRTRFVNDKVFLDVAKGIMLGNLGSTYFKMLDYRKAEQCYIESLALNDRDEQDALLTKIKLAQLYITTNNLNKAFNILNNIKSYSEAKKVTFLNVELRYREVLSNYYDKVGNALRAFTYYKSYNQLKDSIDGVSSDLSDKDVSKEFIKLAQANEIESFKKQNEIKSTYLILAIGFIILSILCIFLVLRDVRASKRNIKKLTVLNSKISGHNEMMQKTLEALEQSQEENSRIMQILAHDMRTPMAGVVGLTSLMLEDDLSEEHREAISMINTSGTDTLNFINDLLQVQYDKSNLIKEPVEMHTLMKYCVTLLDSKAKEKHQQIKIKVVPIILSINREKIWRVMSNILTNAIKFSPNGSEIHIAMELKSSSLLIKIRDSGIGIPTELADKLFTMNADVQREGTGGEKSFGLGLAISKQIIEAHNGSIWFSSEPGIGTCFFIELPITEN